MTDYKEKIKGLLSVDIPENKKIYIWGTGNTTALYQEGLARIDLDIVGYGDNNSSKWGTEAFGKRVFSPDEIKADKENALVLIASPQPNVIEAVGRQMDEMDVEWMHIDKYILTSHKDEVLKAVELFDDDHSKELYAELIDCRINGRYPDPKYKTDNQYFCIPEFCMYSPNEVFADIGAFVGDSLEKYIWEKEGAFKKILAVEPDPQNIRAMNFRIERLKKEWSLSDDKIEIYPYGVGDKSEVRFVERYDGNNGFGSKIVSDGSDNTDEVKIISIDDLIKDSRIKPDIIKADIESYEYKMLKGAAGSIKEIKPKLAICIYHNIVDFYSIPIMIRKLNPDYVLTLRHHTYGLSDTVLYAF